MIRTLVAAYWRRRIRRDLARGLAAAWPAILQLWAGAPFVATGPVGPGAWWCPEAEVARELRARRDPELEAYLLDGARRADGVAAAYCVSVLEDLNSPALATLRAPLTESALPIAVRLCGRGWETTLGEHARTLRDRARRDLERGRGRPAPGGA